MNNPFSALYSTENDITFKLNKKSRNYYHTTPTFKNASDVIIEMKKKDFCNSLRVYVLTIYVLLSKILKQ
jgi:hypothetical protein